MTLSDDFSHIGYKYLGMDKTNVWSKYRLIEGDFVQSRDNHNREVKEKKATVQLESIKGNLSIEERDKNIRLIYKYLGLSNRDRNSLFQRGLSNEDIENGYFFSIQNETILPDNISPRLAGVYLDRNGNTVIGTEFSSGIAIPTFSHNGLISGFQIRRYSKENKYVWSKSRKTNISSHLQNGELPISFHGTGKNTLFLCDGILKSFIAHKRHDIDICGASGGNFSASKSQIIEIAKNYDRVLYIPDGGDIINRQVVNRIKKTHELFSNHDIDLEIAWHNQYLKQNNDIDEIESFSFVGLTIDDFIKLEDKGKFFKKKLDELKSLTVFTPTVEVNEKFISDKLSQVEFEGKVLAVRSPKNTGKTFWLNSLLKSTDKQILLLGNRINLLTVSCNNFFEQGIPFKYIKQDDNELDVLEYMKEMGRIGICIDSALKLKLINWENLLVIVDESEQFLDSLLLSKTHIESIRGKVLALLADRLPQVNSIILMDSDLSDFTVDYFCSIAKKEAVKFENKYQENDRFLFWFNDEDNGELLLAKLDELLAEGRNIVFVSDSAKTCTAIHENYKDKYKAILLTRDNFADNPQLREYTQNQGALIRDNKIQLVIGSPVIQSGISLELNNYFDSTFGLFYGVVTPNVIRQMLLRDRGKGARYVWCRERAVIYQSEYDYKNILKQKDFKNESVMELINFYQFLEDITVHESMEKVLKLFDRTNDTINTINSVARAKLIARKNIYSSDLGATLRDELITENYKITILENEPQGFSAPIADIKEKLDSEQSIRVYESQEITESHAKILEKKDNLKQLDRAKLMKFKIMQRLPQYALSPEFILDFVLKDRYKIINSIQNYYLAKNKEVAIELDKNSIGYQVNHGIDSGLLYLNDIKHNSLLGRLFEGLGLDEILSNPELEINKRWLDTFEQKCRGYRALLRGYGIKWNKQTYRSLLARKIFKLFGFTLVCTSRKESVYQVQKVCAEFDDIYCSLKIRFDNLITKNNYSKIDRISDETQVHTEKGFDPRYKLESDLKTNFPLYQDLKPYGIMDRGVLKNLSTFEPKIEKDEDNTEDKNVYFLEKLFNNLGKEYLLSMSNHELNMFSDGWLQNGMTQTELNQLLSLREMRLT
jgi:hypothetical protein